MRGLTEIEARFLEECGDDGPMFWCGPLEQEIGDRLVVEGLLRERADEDDEYEWITYVLTDAGLRALRIHRLTRALS